MIYDLHVHLAGTGGEGSGNYLAPAFRRRYAYRRLVQLYKFPAGTFDRPDADRQIARQIINYIDASVVDRAVLLALDAAYHEDGTRDLDRTLLVTDNEFVANLAAAHEKILFGASLHPYRHDALSELDWVIHRGACLVKWLPGAQNIQPDHPRCFPFYDALAHHRLPLLCHTGPEHTLKAFSNTLNDPCRLIPALERGVTVIAAHCGARIFPHEKSYFKSWQEMALRYEHFYGDISAFGVPARIWQLRQLLKTPALTAKLVFGSDYPAPQMPLSSFGPLRLRPALKVRRHANPFDQAIAMMRAAGVPDPVFTRAEHLLRLP